MFEFQFPKVTIIRQPDLALVREAWLHSRPNENPRQLTLEHILKIDAPVNEFARVTAQFYAPILVREILCTLRDHVVWARTSRVDDLTTWPVHPLAESSRDILWRHYSSMQRLKDAGEPQDVYREYLPLGYMTHFTVSLSLRTWLNLANYFRRLAQTPSGDMCELWAQMHNAMLARLEPAWLRDVRYKFPDICPPYSHHEMESGVKGNFVVAHATVPIALRAQVIRHRAFMVSDNLQSFFRTEKLASPIYASMRMQVVARRDIAEGIVTKRSCWIAQTDLWEPLIEQLTMALGGTRDPILPCDYNDPVIGCECPYRRDNELRRIDKDPAPPCPRAAVMHGQVMTEEQRTRARAYADQRSTSAFWHSELKLEEEVNG